MRPFLIMLAGPNGAGKSTFYDAYLSQLDTPFLNADEFSKRFGLDAYTAAGEIANIRDALVNAGKSFITETVFSDPIGEKVSVLAAAAKAGTDVRLIYIGLRDANLSAERVTHRIQAGGHPVPAEKLKARYSRSLQNLNRAIQQLPLVTVYDNSSYQSPFRFVAEFRGGDLISSGVNANWFDYPSTSDPSDGSDIVRQV